MAKGSGGKQGGQARGQDGATTQREGYTVDLGKEAWAEELFAACRRLGLPPDRKGRPNLRALAKERAQIKSPYTLIANIRSKGDPQLETLRKLERGAGVPLVRSLLALRMLERADLETELGLPPGSAPNVPPAVRRLIEAWVEAWAALPPALARDLLDTLRAVGAPGSGDNSPGPSPTGADPP